MKYFLALNFIFLNLVFADCNFSMTAEDFEANWTAFKTPSKIGVGGRFRELGLKKEAYKGKTLSSILKGKEYKINTRSIWTRNAARDAKIIKYFFTGFKGGFVISGKIKEFDDEDMLMSVKMNGVEKDIPMKVKIDKNYLTATGTIDVFDFTLSDNLKAINMACKALHQGKTWNDVDLELKINFKKKCS